LHPFAEAFFLFFLHLGGFGLLLLGIIDAILFTPLANDVLLVALTSSNRSHWFYYACMATLGSVMGCFILYVISRRGGEKGLARALSPKRFEYVKRKLAKQTPWAVAAASILPPPFPFTPIIAGAAAFQYPRPKLLGIIAVARLVRFTTLALLAVRFGRHILDIANSPVVYWSMIGLVVISIIGSVYTIVTRVRRGRE
jgi:membrane protein YqaA with SNARE-associated domain